MDPSTIIGIVLAFVAIFGSMIMEGGNPAAMLLPPSIMLVFLGTFGVSMASAAMKDVTGLAAALKAALTPVKAEVTDLIAAMVKFAEIARREGLLALEEAAKEIDNPFLKKGIEFAIDGTDPEELAEILEAEISAKKAEIKNQSKFFENMGGFAPTLGIIGTVLGLVHVLENLSDPSKLGHLIAGAFVATLWGVMTANVMWLPMANKIKRMGEDEVHHMEIILEGIMSIQAGANPRVIEQKLTSFLPEKERPVKEEQAA
jgi:chemotaxis protein MotA